MTHHKLFLDDYFNLPLTIWVDKYRAKIPTGMTAVRFAEMISDSGLELRMVDHVGPIKYSPSLPVYIFEDVAADPEKPYFVVLPEGTVGGMMEEGRFAALSEAIKLKTKLLFIFLA